MARVLIIGATSAIATAVAGRYADRGDTVFVLGRKANKLVAVKKILATRLAGCIVADFNQTDKCSDWVEEAVTALGGVDIALIAHGYLGLQQSTEEEYSQAAHVLITNLLSVVAFLVPLANVMACQGYGHIGVITSVAGDRGRPRNYTYGAAKGGVTLYLQGLRSRLWSSGVQVHTIKLGPVDTPMTVDHYKDFSFATVEQVAPRIIQILDGKGGEVYVPGFWRWVMCLVRWMPEWLFQRLKFLSGG